MSKDLTVIFENRLHLLNNHCAFFNGLPQFTGE